MSSNTTNTTTSTNTTSPSPLFEEVQFDEAPIRQKFDAGKLLENFINANIKYARVTVIEEDRPRGLRNLLNSRVQYHKLPVKLFEREGELYMERIDATAEELADVRRRDAMLKQDGAVS